jgi:hypothetical protein
MQRTELLIFLTPRIIKSDEEAEMFKQIEMERLNFIESEAERMHGPLFSMSEYNPPGTDPGSAAPVPEPAAPAGPVTRSSRRKSQTGPSAPDANIPAPASTKKTREPHPMPAVEDDEVRGAAQMRNDDEDLDAAFIQTGYRTSQNGGSAPGKAPSAKSDSKSPLTKAKAGKSTAKSPAKQKPQTGTDQKRSRNPERDDS